MFLIWQASHIKPNFDIIDADSGEIIAPADKKVTPRLVKKLVDQKSDIKIIVPFENIVGRYAAVDIINEETGEIWVEAGDELTWEVDQKTGNVVGGSLFTLINNGINEIPTLDIDNVNIGPYIRNTMIADKNFNYEMALVDIYRVMRPGEPPTIDAAINLCDTLFLYDTFL